jgi:HAD superfamily hydrolase (TIGR01490 family)
MNLALFDFDGTITSADTFTPFVRLAAGRSRVLAGSAILSPLLLGYALGVVPTKKVRAAVARCAFWGRPRERVAALGAEYAESLTRVVRPEAVERIRWHQAHGDTVVVVSASLDAYLIPWCQSQKLELICTELESRAGTLTGRYRGGDCTGTEKARRVRERYALDRYPVVYAYGDTDEDRELLGLAHKQYLNWRELR